MAIPGIDNEELELIRKLRVEWNKDLATGFAQAKKDGFVDDETKSRMAKTDAKLIEVTDKALVDQQKQIDAQGKRIDDQDVKLKAYGERISRPPGLLTGDAAVQDFKTLGQRFVEADNFKNAQFAGKFQIQVGLVKTRIRQKALVPITEGGQTTITPPVGAYPIFPSRVGLIPQQYVQPTMRDLVDVIPLDGTNAVEYVTEAWTNGAAYQVLEGDVKGTSAVTYTEHTAVVRTIAHYVKVSRQMAADVNFIIATINNRLTIFVLIKEDAEILNGDNSAGHLWGIMPQATPATVYYPGPAPATDNPLDQLNAATAYIENQFYFPTAFVLNPTTWYRIESMKTTFGQYLLPGSPIQDGPGQRLWGLPVVTTPVMSATDYLCGAFPGNAALFDRESVNVEMAFQNEDDFIRNLITIRAEERVAFAVFVPKAFAKGPFLAPLVLGGLGADDATNGGKTPPLARKP